MSFPLPDMAQSSTSPTSLLDNGGLCSPALLVSSNYNSSNHDSKEFERHQRSDNSQQSFKFHYQNQSQHEDEDVQRRRQQQARENEELQKQHQKYQQEHQELLQRHQELQQRHQQRSQHLPNSFPIPKHQSTPQQSHNQQEVGSNHHQQVIHSNHRNKSSSLDDAIEQLRNIAVQSPLASPMVDGYQTLPIRSQQSTEYREVQRHQHHMSASDTDSADALLRGLNSSTPVRKPSVPTQLRSSDPSDSNLFAPEVCPGFPTNGLSHSPHPSSIEFDRAGRCSCCPYGFHVNTDFLNDGGPGRAVEKVHHLRKIRSDKRAARKSMEILLSQHVNGEVLEIAPQQSSQPPLSQQFSTIDQDDSATSLFLNDIDKALKHAHKSRTFRFAQKSSDQDSVKVRDSSASSLTRSDSQETITSGMSEAAFNVRQTVTSHQLARTMATHLPDTGPVDSVTITQESLRQIKEHISLSLQRMRELEEQVKVIPLLQERISVLKEEKRMVTLQLQAHSAHLNMRSMGVGDGDVREELEPIVQIVEKERAKKPSRSVGAGEYDVTEELVASKDAYHTMQEHVQRLKETELRIMEQEIKEQLIAQKPATRSIGSGDANVLESTTESGVKITERETKTIVIGDVGEEKDMRSVSLQVKPHTRDATCQYVHQDEKAPTRSVGVNVDITDLVQSFSEQQTAMATSTSSRRGSLSSEGSGGESGGALMTSGSWSMQSHMIQRKFMEAMYSGRKEDLMLFIQSLLRRSVRSVGCTARPQTFDAGVNPENVGTRSVGAGECSTDVDVRPRVCTRETASLAKPTSRNQPTWTDLIVTRDEATNTRPVPIEKPVRQPTPTSQKSGRDSETPTEFFEEWTEVKTIPHVETAVLYAQQVVPSQQQEAFSSFESSQTQQVVPSQQQESFSSFESSQKQQREEHYQQSKGMSSVGVGPARVSRLPVPRRNSWSELSATERDSTPVRKSVRNTKEQDGAAHHYPRDAAARAAKIVYERAKADPSALHLLPSGIRAAVQGGSVERVGKAGIPTLAEVKGSSSSDSDGSGRRRHNSDVSADDILKGRHGAMYSTTVKRILNPPSYDLSVTPPPKSRVYRSEVRTYRTVTASPASAQSANRQPEISSSIVGGVSSSRSSSSQQSASSSSGGFGSGVSAQQLLNGMQSSTGQQHVTTLTAKVEGDAGRGSVTTTEQSETISAMLGGGGQQTETSTRQVTVMQTASSSQDAALFKPSEIQSRDLGTDFFSSGGKPPPTGHSDRMRKYQAGSFDYSAIGEAEDQRNQMEVHGDPLKGLLDRAASSRVSSSVVSESVQITSQQQSSTNLSSSTSSSNAYSSSSNSGRSSLMSAADLLNAPAPRQLSTVQLELQPPVPVSMDSSSASNGEQQKQLTSQLTGRVVIGRKFEGAAGMNGKGGSSSSEIRSSQQSTEVSDSFSSSQTQQESSSEKRSIMRNAQSLAGSPPKRSGISFAQDVIGGFCKVRLSAIPEEEHGSRVKALMYRSNSEDSSDSSSSDDDNSNDDDDDDDDDGDSSYDEGSYDGRKCEVSFVAKFGTSGHQTQRSQAKGEEDDGELSEDNDELLSHIPSGLPTIVVECQSPTPPPDSDLMSDTDIHTVATADLSAAVGGCELPSVIAESETKSSEHTDQKEEVSVVLDASAATLETKDGGDDVVDTAASPPPADLSAEGGESIDIDVELQAACSIVQQHLENTGSIPQSQVNSAMSVIQQDWFKVASGKSANPREIDDYLACFNDFSHELLQHIVNMVDGNGNSVMHYAVSHCNFPVIRVMLDTGLCDMNLQNKAGYTPVMLAALADLQASEDKEIIKQLLSKGNVNMAASQAGQTALMLSVSHGKVDLVQLLLQSNADVNTQDEDGSTALMCATEHGHIEIVKLLLAQPSLEITAQDNDGSTALSIAMEAGHRDIGLLLYAKEQSNKAMRAKAVKRSPGQSKIPAARSSYSRKL